MTDTKNREAVPGTYDAPASDDGWPGGRWLPVLLFGGVALLTAIDVVADLATGGDALHVLVEVLVVLVAGAGTVFAWRRWHQERQALRGARVEAARWRAEADRWRDEAQEALQGLRLAIDRQFERWSLTGAEREVALLLLKGLSFKEVAHVRGTSERTARQQARAVYRKAELGGRAELSAFFLEDLLVPVPPEEESAAQPSA